MKQYNLERFKQAQESEWGGYAAALKEIQAGLKTSHWIWYIFPQLKGLGHSYNSAYFGIANLEEAKAYLSDEVLGARLREITQALMKHTDKSAYDILGGIDARKVKSCMTLFDAVSPNDIFSTVLTTFFNGERDKLTHSSIIAEVVAFKAKDCQSDHFYVAFRVNMCIYETDPQYFEAEKHGFVDSDGNAPFDYANHKYCLSDQLRPISLDYCQRAGNDDLCERAVPIIGNPADIKDDWIIVGIDNDKIIQHTEEYMYNLIIRMYNKIVHIFWTRPVNNDDR